MMWSLVSSFMQFGIKPNLHSNLTKTLRIQYRVVRNFKEDYKSGAPRCQ